MVLVVLALVEVIQLGELVALVLMEWERFHQESLSMPLYLPGSHP